jgi:hypothetical protein
MKNLQIKYPNKLKECRENPGFKQNEIAILLDFKDSGG